MTGSTFRKIFRGIFPVKPAPRKKKPAKKRKKTNWRGVFRTLAIWLGAFAILAISVAILVFYEQEKTAGARFSAAFARVAANAGTGAGNGHKTTRNQNWVLGEEFSSVEQLPEEMPDAERTAARSVLYAKRRGTGVRPTEGVRTTFWCVPWNTEVHLDVFQDGQWNTHGFCIGWRGSILYVSSSTLE